MRRSKFMESQFVAILKSVAHGLPVADAIRKHGISRETYFFWKSKYAGTTVAEMKRLREMEAENAKLKRMYAELAGEQRSGTCRPASCGAAREAAGCHAVGRRAPTFRRAGVPPRQPLAVAYYRPPPDARDRDKAVIAALSTVAADNPRWGFWKCFDRVRLDGQPWHWKRVHRLYRSLRLHLPRRRKKRLLKRVQMPVEAPPILHHVWALDFMHDMLYDGQRFRTLNVLDEGNREAWRLRSARRYQERASPPSWINSSRSMERRARSVATMGRSWSRGH